MTDEPRSTNDESHRLRLLVQELREQIDTVWLLKRSGHSGSLSARLLHETASVLPTLPGDLQEKYFEIAIELFGSIAPPIMMTESSDALVATAAQSSEPVRAGEPVPARKAG